MNIDLEVESSPVPDRGNGKEKRTPHHFASAFSRRRDGDGGGREVTGWPMDAAVAVDAKTRPRAVSSSDSGRRGEWSIESVCREFTL